MLRSSPWGSIDGTLPLKRTNALLLIDDQLDDLHCSYSWWSDFNVPEP